MSDDIPRDASGAKVCQQCHVRPVRVSLGTKPWIYCGRSCRQRAVETRKQAAVVQAALAAAAEHAAAKARVFPELQQPARVFPPAAPVPDPALPEVTPWRVSPRGARPRRPPVPKRKVEVEAPPLWEE
jgi:hypothetical protein